MKGTIQNARRQRKEEADFHRRWLERQKQREQRKREQEDERERIFSRPGPGKGATPQR